LVGGDLGEQLRIRFDAEGLVGSEGGSSLVSQLVLDLGPIPAKEFGDVVESESGERASHQHQLWSTGPLASGRLGRW